MPHRLRRETEAAMRELLRKEFLLVWREGDDQWPPAGTEHPRGFLDRARSVVEKMQNLMQDDDVEGVIAERQVVEVALPHTAMLDARSLQPVARDRQHVERQIEPEAALDVRAE